DAKEGAKVRGRGTSTDVILASARAYVNALNTLDRTEKSQSSSDRVKTGSTP
ncbi:MAG TPA: alpha-isopropylmalate synthase regulatory domain-containing protein, partial [Candidatus Sumerlaeota bacterium]|nr:alpha-isopropylmalate synthase regulatory domain-containing protein [Candidatus Sumerlaeota bacterium]